MTTALAIAPSRHNPFEAETIGEAVQLSDMLAKSALVPAALRGKPQDILLILATARELGIGPMQALADVNVIQGKPVLSADLMISLCRRRPDVCKYITLIESTDTRAVYETHRVGAPKPETFTFTMDDAKKLGLGMKDNYVKQAKTMLRRRCAAALARETYQDLVRGYDPDEAEDFAKPIGTTRMAVPPDPRPDLAPLPPVAAPADAVVEPTQPEDTESEAEEEWSEVSAIKVRIAACTSLSQLLVLGQELKKLPDDVRARLRADYAAKQAALKEAK